AVCVDTPSTGDPINTKCADNGMRPTCAGVCIPIGGSGIVCNTDSECQPSETCVNKSCTNTMCSQACGLAGEDPIESSLDCGGTEIGLCLYSVQGTGPGDNAYCTGACTSHEDCRQGSVLYCFDYLHLGP